MKASENMQGKRIDQVGYSNAVVVLGLILFIVSVVILKIEQLMA
jgi:hypothetical protein